MSACPRSTHYTSSFILLLLLEGFSCRQAAGDLDQRFFFFFYENVSLEAEFLFIYFL